MASSDKNICKRCGKQLNGEAKLFCKECWCYTACGGVSRKPREICEICVAGKWEPKEGEQRNAK